MTTQTESLWRLFVVFLRLGLTSFGGPTAHIAYFRDEFVSRRRWLSEQHYADLVALCQFLPGPASSQVGLSLGLMRGGYLGALLAWIGFTLPSAILLILFALGIAQDQSWLSPSALHGLKIVAVAVVAQALLGMGRQFCSSTLTVGLAIASAVILLLAPGMLAQMAVIVAAGVIGSHWLKGQNQQGQPVTLSVQPRTGYIALGFLLVLLAGLPLISAIYSSHTLEQFAAFFRAGSMVFGGGHVVLPLLHSETVLTSWVTHEAFVAGYGAAQAVPGPLFTFSAFLGASMQDNPTGWLGGLWCLVAIFLPSFFLLLAALPFWVKLSAKPKMRGALSAINAAVVGLLGAAFYAPVWTSAITSAQDVALGLVAFGMLKFAKCPPWLVVLAYALGGMGGGYWL